MLFFPISIQFVIIFISMIFHCAFIRPKMFMVKLVYIFLLHKYTYFLTNFCLDVIIDNSINIYVLSQQCDFITPISKVAASLYTAPGIFLILFPYSMGFFSSVGSILRFVFIDHCLFASLVFCTSPVSKIICSFSFFLLKIYLFLLNRCELQNYKDICH